MSLWAVSPYFLLVWIWLLLLVKQSHITCLVGNVQLLITYLCLHSELNDLKNCGLKWKGEGREGRHIRKKRGSGMHSKLRNLNFPAHLKQESHWKCRTRCSSGVNSHGSLVLRELCKYLSAKDAGHFFFFPPRYLGAKGNIIELFISRSCARFTPDKQEHDISAGGPHLHCPIQPNLSIRICSCRKVPAHIPHVQAVCHLLSPWRQHWHLLLLSSILSGTHFFLQLIKKHVGKVAVSSTTGIYLE